MTKEKEKKAGKDQLLLEASRLGRFQQLESILSQMQQLKCKKRANPLASLRKIVGPNSARDPVTGFTCLHHAALNGHADCVQLMLDYGAKVNAVDYKGSSALHLAAWVGNLEVVRILLARRLLSSPNNKENMSAEQDSSSSSSHCQSPTQKLQSKSQSTEVDLCNNDNQTPLSLAAQFGHTEVVSELLANGASVLVRNSQLESPLELACLNGRLETVDLLLRSAPVLVADLQRPRATIANLNVPHGRNQQQLPASWSPSSEQPQPQPQTNHHHQLERSATTTSSPPAQPLTSSRRQSGGGWSALLRGKRAEQQNNAPTATSQSPLHRLTSGTLSMRQNKAQQQVAANIVGRNNQLRSQLSSSSSTSSTSSPNAAKLAAREAASLQPQRQLLSAAAEQRQQLLVAHHQRQVSADWAPLIAANSSGNQPAEQSVMTTTTTTGNEQQQTEKLLEHSPLHYATRRGHLNVINLLLYTYQANILQVSSRGSILHEIALNNGKHSGDIINAAFVYLTNLPDNQNRLEVLDRFLNLRNANQQNVFEVLNEINNRSAQEIKRFIYEFSEQIHQLASQQQQHTQLNTQANLTTSNNNLQSSSLPQQQMHQFSDINQISSFVTMKRAPKSGEQQQFGHPQNAFLVDSTGRHLNWRQQQPQQFPYGTQTIDLRQLRDSQQQQAAALQQQLQLKRTFPQVAASGAQMDQTQHQNLHQFQAGNSLGLLSGQSPAITRSVSNLSRVSSQRAANNQLHLQHIDQQQQQQQHQQQAALASRKRRSRSRDLGSLLMEAQQQHRFAETTGTSGSNGQASPFDNAPPPTSAQLVRSQTDCSHLMGRFFGDQLGSTGCLPAATSASNDLQRQQQCAQKHSTLDRKMINRHYHVYEHQFYPPRLLGGGQEVHSGASSNTAGRQQVAVVPPLSRATAANEQRGLLRASIRSTASCQVPAANANQNHNLPPTKLTSANQAAEFGFGADNNSRLSLNMEPQASGARAAELERRKPQLPSCLAGQAGFQQQQMDRFLYRHARKSAAASCADSYQQSGETGPIDVSGGARCASSADQHRQELVELQRRLVAEQSAGQQQQQPMHTSYSLESHLSEPQLLFETTRQTLMKDFDQMIGNKLLNRDHRQIIDGNLGQQAAPSSQQRAQRATAAGSKSSIFTGVSLDMDQFGERLTVSGTRVTTSAVVNSELRNQLQQAPALSAGSKRSLQQAKFNASSTPAAAADCNMMSAESNFSNNSTQTDLELGADDANYDDCDEFPREPPPKPPRLSLLNKQQQQQVLVRPLEPKHTQQPDDDRNQQPQRATTTTARQTLYDQPASGAESISTSTSSLVAQVPPKRPKQPVKAASFARQQASLGCGKPPPTSKPPPVPCPPKNRKVNPNLNGSNKSLSTPLQILAASGGGQPMINSGSSTTSSGSSSIGNRSTDQQSLASAASVGLLKMATSASAGSGQFSLASKQQAALGGGANALALALRTAQSLGDPDSGVCTSNSPASLSHDSEEPPAEFQQQAERHDNSLKRCKQSEASDAKATANLDSSLSAVVKHLARTGSQTSTGPSSKTNNRTNNCRSVNLSIEKAADRLDLAAPPSPNTAQLCIEEALMPLAKPPTTSDVANQTTSPICMSNTTDECQFVSPYSVSFVDRWLVESPAQHHHQQQVVADAAADDDGHDDDSRRSTEADYDNCHGSALLQRQLQSARCRSIGDLLLVAPTGHTANTSSGGGVGGREDEEGDYAAESSTTTSQTSSNGTQTTSSELASTSSNSSLAKQTQTGRHDDDESPVRAGQLSSPNSSSSSSSSSADAAAQPCQGKRKELVLRVMIDEPPLGSVSGDDVFYINPLELKKLATPKNETMDAGTLTDEELCAAFDKSSGFIRFTLRKRRNHQQAQETVASKQSLAADDFPGCFFEGQHQQSLSAPKKTKLSQWDEAETRMSHQMAEPSPLSGQLKIRRHSEMTNQSTVGYNSNKFDNSTSKAESHTTPAGISLSSSQSQLQLSGSMGADSHLLAQDFNNNANASRLINRSSAIQLRQWFSVNLVALCDYVDRFLLFGLDNVNFLNHPQLMNDTVLKMVGISQETHRLIILDRVGSQLAPVDFESLFKGLPTNASLVSLAKVFELLQMSHLQTMLMLGGGASGDLQLELSLADPNCIESIKRLDLSTGYRARLTMALDYIRNKIQQQQDEQQRALVVHGKRLTQQGSSESSEIEMDTSQASSSSSKESIKSIVLVRTNQSSSAISALATNAQVASTTTTPIPKTEQDSDEEQVVEAKVSPTAPFEEAKTSSSDYFEKPPEGRKEDQKKPDIKQEQVEVGKASRASSLVSEAARKLEAAQKGANSVGGGAVCFTLKPVAATRRINTAKIATTGADGKRSTTTTSDSLADSSESSKTTSGKTTTPNFVPVRSVCWPPKSNQQQQSQIKSSNGQLHGKLQQEQLAIGNKVIGPKPAPPAKPAKLAASKFGASTSTNTNKTTTTTTGNLESNSHRF